MTQAEREKDRSDGRAARLEALCKEQERRLKAYEDLTGCSLKVFALEATEDEEVECVATSKFHGRKARVPARGAARRRRRIHFEAGAGAGGLDERAESSPPSSSTAPVPALPVADPRARAPVEGRPRASLSGVIPFTRLARRR